MRKLFLLFCLIISAASYGQTVLWFEDFEGEGNGATSGTPTGSLATTWSVIQAPSGGTFSRQSTGGNNRFTINNTGANEGVWSSGVINISGQGEVGLETTLVNYYATNSGDYVKAFYKINGGPETPFGEVLGGNDYEVSAQASAIISGNTVEIIIRAKETTTGNILLVIPRMMRFDDVRLVKIGTLYSLNGGNWSNGATWASSPSTITSCGCTPSEDTHVVIRHAVSVNGNGTAVNITVNAASQLRWTGNYALTVARGGTVSVAATGSINRNSNGSATLDFNWPGVSNSVNVALAGSINIGLLTITNASTVSFSGAGSIAVSDDMVINTNAAISSSVTGGFSIADDFNFNTSNASFTNSGTLTALDFVVTDIDKNNNTFTNTGTFNVTNIVANNGNLIINNNGTINQSGNFPNTTLDADSKFTNGATGVWNWSYVAGAAIDTDIRTVFDCSKVGNTFNYSGNGAQTIQSLTFFNLELSGSGTKSTIGNITIGGNLSITGFAQLDVDTGNDNVAVAGNWIVSSLNVDPFVQGSGSETVTFSGTAHQSITNLGGETFNRLIVNKNGGTLNLNNNVIISNTTGIGLNLIQGIVNSSMLGMLIINDDVTSTGGSTSSFVDGPVRKIGDDSFTFPVGDGTRWSRIRMSNLTNATSTTQFTAQYFAARYSENLVDLTLHHASGAEYWMLDRGLLDVATATVTLYWQDDFSEVSNLTDLTVAHFTGLRWVNAGKSASSGNATAGSVSSGTVTSFSPFTLGSIGGTNPLPVELKYFRATLMNDEVQLKWETASEKNNDFFTIEKTANPESFEELLRRDGNGTTTTPHVYTEVDHDPYFGRSYYRLKQTDVDGTSSYSDVQTIDYSGPEHATLNVLQNPVKDHVLKVEIDGLKNTTMVPLSLMNVQGQAVYNTTLTVTTPGKIREDVTLDKSLPAGLYILRAGRTRHLQAKIIVE